MKAANYQHVRYIETDLFAWRPEAKYDVVFFSFWLSHVPDDRFEKFWMTVGQALGPNGKAFLIDSRAESTTARDHSPPEAEGLQERRLSDGRSIRLFKRYWEDEQLSRRLEQLSFATDLHDTQTYFVYGSACRNVHVE